MRRKILFYSILFYSILLVIIQGFEAVLNSYLHFVTFDTEIYGLLRLIQKEKIKMSYELSEILITVVIQTLYIVFKIGRFEEKLNILEKKQENKDYNGLV